MTISTHSNQDRHPCTNLDSAKWGWACRILPEREDYRVEPVTDARVGDVLVGRVRSIQNHTRIMTRDSGRVRMYVGDIVVGVVGHRYATDAFEGFGKVRDGVVHLMTNAGMMGQVHRRHAAVKAPTELEVLGRLVTEDGVAVNLIERGFRRRAASASPANVVFVVGTGMNAGKTTSATKLVRGLIGEGLKVAALKVTGSVSPNDRTELEATGAAWVRDFSDYGFPSTYLAESSLVNELFETMLADAGDVQPDVVVVELADGVLQRETRSLLAQASRWSMVRGTVLAAPCALSAMKGCEVIQKEGLSVIGITGIISNAPLFIEEFQRNSQVPVLTSNDQGQRLGRGVAEALQRIPAAVQFLAA